MESQNKDKDLNSPTTILGFPSPIHQSCVALGPKPLAHQPVAPILEGCSMARKSVPGLTTSPPMLTGVAISKTSNQKSQNINLDLASEVRSGQISNPLKPDSPESTHKLVGEDSAVARSDSLDSIYFQNLRKFSGVSTISASHQKTSPMSEEANRCGSGTEINVDQVTSDGSCSSLEDSSSEEEPVLSRKCRKRRRYKENLKQKKLLSQLCSLALEETSTTTLVQSTSEKTKITSSAVKGAVNQDMVSKGSHSNSKKEEAGDCLASLNTVGKPIYVGSQGAHSNDEIDLERKRKEEKKERRKKKREERKMKKEERKKKKEEEEKTNMKQNVIFAGQSSLTQEESSTIEGQSVTETTRLTPRASKAECSGKPIYVDSQGAHSNDEIDLERKRKEEEKKERRKKKRKEKKRKKDEKKKKKAEERKKKQEEERKKKQEEEEKKTNMNQNIIFDGQSSPTQEESSTIEGQSVTEKTRLTPRASKAECIGKTGPLKPGLRGAPSNPNEVIRAAYYSKASAGWPTYVALRSGYCMDKHDFVKLRVFVEEKIMSIPLEERTPIFNRSKLKTGRVRVVCADEWSFNWIASQISSSSKWYVPNSLNPFLPTMDKFTVVSDPGRTPDTFLYLLARQNPGLDISQVHLLSMNHRHTDTVFGVGLDARMTTYLKERGFRLCCGLDKVLFREGYGMPLSSIPEWNSEQDSLSDHQHATSGESWRGPKREIIRQETFFRGSALGPQITDSSRGKGMSTSKYTSSQNSSWSRSRTMQGDQKRRGNPGPCINQSSL